MSAILILIPLIVLITIGIIGLIIYLGFYSKKANARLTGEYNPETGSRIPSPSSALSTLWKIAVVVCFAILFIKIGSLSDSIISLNSDINYRFHTIQNNLDERLEEAVAQQNSLFTEHGYNLLSIDWNTLTAEVEYYAIPKEISDSASFSLSLDGNEYRMENKGTEWAAVLKIGIFDWVNHEMKASILDNGITKKESWQEDIEFKEGFFETNGISIKHSITKGKLTVNGSYRINLPLELDAKDVILTVMVGNTVWKTEELAKRSDTLFEIIFNDTIPVKAGDTVSYTVNWSFQNGKKGEKVLETCVISEDAKYLKEYTRPKDSVVTIYDKDGSKIN